MDLVKTFISILTLACVALNGATAEDTENADVDAILGSDLVEKVSGRYVHEQVNFCRMTNSEPGATGPLPIVTISRYIEAPADLLSRDQFVSISTQLLLRNRLALVSVLRPGIDPVAAAQAVACRPRAGSEGSIDFRIHIAMSRSGIDIETTDEASGKRGLDHVDWVEILNLEAE